MAEETAVTPGKTTGQVRMRHDKTKVASLETLYLPQVGVGESITVHSQTLAEAAYLFLGQSRCLGKGETVLPGLALVYSDDVTFTGQTCENRPRSL